MNRQTQYRGTDRQTDRQGEVHLLGLVGVCCTADSVVDGTDRQTDRQTDKVRYTYWVWSECVVQLTLLSTELTDKQTDRQTR